MTKWLFLVVSGLWLISAQGQKGDVLGQVREDFQRIKGKEDIEQLNKIAVDDSDAVANTIRAYQGAATCMMAEYVFSPIKKLQYFNDGKKSLERSIKNDKSVETIYCRLLIQLNVPGFLNYHDEIKGDIDFFKAELPKAKIDAAYKEIMIKNLVTLSKKEDIKQSLLNIDLEGND